MRINKATGKYSKTLEEYEDVFEYLMDYLQVKLRRNDFDKITNKAELAELFAKKFDGKVLAKGARTSSSLSEWIAKTDLFKETVKNNLEYKQQKERDVFVEKAISRKPSYSTKKEYAKKRQLIFLGKDSRGHKYAYDYLAKKRTFYRRK